MNMTTFTKGPYHMQFLSERVGLPYMVLGDNLAAIARVHSEKDARLIAAAPELFAQCKFLEKVLTEAIMSGDGGADLELDQLRKILANVEGEKCDISLDDKFECEQCGRVDDIEESRQLGGKKGILVCGGCVEGEK